MYFNLNKSYSLIIIIFLSASIFDPVGAHYNFKYFALAMAIFVAVINATLTQKKLGIENKTLIILFCLPIFAIPSTVATGGINKEFIDTSYIAFSILLIPLMFYQYRFDTIIQKYLTSLYFILSFSVTTTAVVFLTNINSNVLNYLSEYSIAIIAWRGSFGYTLPFIYFLSSPLLIFAVGIATIRLLEHKTFLSLMFFVLSMSAMLLTGSRSNIILSLIVPLTICLTSINVKKRLIIMMIASTAASIFVIVIIFNPQFLSNNLSDLKRVQVLQEIIEILDRNYFSVFGTGFNFAAIDNSFNTLSKGGSRVELTFLEILRVFGLLIGSLYIILIFLPLFMKNKDIRVRSMYAIYLLNSFFNPYLHSINGIVAIFTVLAFERENNVSNS